MGVADGLLLLLLLEEDAVAAPGPTSMLSLQLPPHISALLPEQGMLHCESGASTAAEWRVLAQ